jgi:hypothetical protein
MARAADDAEGSPGTGGGAVSTKPAPDKKHAPAGEELGDVVFGVHFLRSHEISATRIIWRILPAAESWAVSVSNNPDLLAAGATRYMLNTPGHRAPIALFVRGERQAVPYISDDQRIFANGHGRASLHDR